MQATKCYAAAAAGALSLAGCATKEPPTTAEIHAATGSLTNISLTEPWRAGGVAGGIQDDWLASFGDPQLAALVAEAMTNSPDLRVTAIRVDQAAQYIEFARAALRPTVSLLGVGGLNMGGGDISSALQGLSLGASWEPDLWGRLRYGRNAAQATYASALADFEFSRQSLAAGVAKSWFTATETWLQMRTADEMIAASRELVDLAEKRDRIGAGSEQDVALARAGLHNFEDAAQQLRFAHSQTLIALELLLGRYPAAELEARQELIQLPGPIPTGIPLEALERRPDLVAAERRVAAAFNRVGEAKAARLPRIVLSANVAVLDSEILQLKDDFENPTGGAGARLVAPLYQGGALNTQVAIRTLEQQEAVAEYACMALRALGDVETALGSSQTLVDRLPILEAMTADNQRALELAQTRYRLGTTDMRAVQQQQISLNTARLALLRVRSEQLIQRVNLHLALGGSFAERSLPEPRPSTPAPAEDEYVQSLVNQVSRPNPAGTAAAGAH